MPAIDDPKNKFHLDVDPPASLGESLVCVVLPVDQQTPGRGCEGVDLATTTNAILKQPRPPFGLALVRVADESAMGGGWMFTVTLSKTQGNVASKEAIQTFVNDTALGMRGRAHGDAQGSSYDTIKTGVRFAVDVDVREGDPAYKTSRVVAYASDVPDGIELVTFLGDPPHAPAMRLAADEMMHVGLPLASPAPASSSSAAPASPSSAGGPPLVPWPIALAGALAIAALIAVSVRRRARAHRRSS